VVKEAEERENGKEEKQKERRKSSGALFRDATPSGHARPWEARNCCSEGFPRPTGGRYSLTNLRVHQAPLSLSSLSGGLSGGLSASPAEAADDEDGGGGGAVSPVGPAVSSPSSLSTVVEGVLPPANNFRVSPANSFGGAVNLVKEVQKMSEAVEMSGQRRPNFNPWKAELRKNSDNPKPIPIGATLEKLR